MNPPPVAELPQRTPSSRDQNVNLGIAENAVQGFDYYLYSFVNGRRVKQLSLWGFPWWLADEASAPASSSFSTAFSSAYDGGLDSPSAPAWGRGFSSAFG